MALVPFRRRQYALTLPWATFLSGIGLAAQEGAYQLAYSTSSPLVEPLFFFGLLLLVLPLATILIGRSANRTGRLAAALIMAEALFWSRWLAHPALFATFDSLLHLTSLWQLVDHQRFFTENTLLPVSGYYPGLEVLTAGVHWITGLPTVPAQLLTLLLARALLISALYLAFERITHSGRAAGMGIVLYCANPEFYSFDAQYAYETLALTWAALAAYYMLRTLDAPARGVLRPTSPRPAFRPSGAGTGTPSGHPLASALAAVAALVLLAITHHVTSWLVLIGLVLVLGRLIQARDARAAKIALAFACLDTLAVGLWTLLVGNRLSGYLGPLIRQALSSVGGILIGQQHTKSLFVQPAGSGTPAWERALISVSVLLWVALIAVALLSRPARAARRRSRALALLAFCSLGYFALMAARLSPAATEFGNRAAAIVFVPVACVVGVWWARSAAAGRARYVAASLIVLGLLVVGGVALGTGSYHQRYPGPYLVEADQRSVDGPSLDAARWARAHLPTGVRIGADRDNSAVMAAIGHLTPVTQSSGSVNVGPLFFAKSIGSGQTSTIRRGRIRLLLVDHRLSRSLPYVGVYFEPGETADLPVSPNQAVRLSPEQISKFDRWNSAVLIHRDGPISIYDLSDVLGLPPVAVSRTPAPRGDLATTDWWPLAAVLVLAALWLGTERKRRRPPGDSVAGLVGAGLGVAVACVLMACLITAVPGSPLWLVLPFLGSVGCVLVLTRRPRPWTGLSRIEFTGPVPPPIVAAGRGTRRHSGRKPRVPSFRRRRRAAHRR